MVFSIGSRLENVTSVEFAQNPTKIVNALRQIRSSLKVDGVCCYFDPSLERGALDGDGVRPSQSSADQVLQRGRVPIVMEVLKRARIVLKDTALIVRVTGPATIASQLTHSEGEPGWSNRELIEFCAEVCAALCKAYVEAGADVVLLEETVLSARTAEPVMWWGSLLEPIANVIRFYEALPVLVLDGEQLSADTVRFIVGRPWDFLLCPSARTYSLLSSDEWNRSAAGIGVAFPVEVLSDPKEVEPIRKLIADAKPVMLTTVEDVPVATDLKHLAANLQQFRGLVAART
jgi:hypothetical protein